MRKTVIILFIVLLNTICNAQQLNSYQQDFLQLAEIIQNTHPANDSVKNALKDLQGGIVEELANCDGVFDFRLVAQQYMALLHDGHSQLDLENYQYGTAYYPVYFQGQNSRVFIGGCHKSLPINLIGKEVKSLNGVAVDTLMLRARPYFSCDNEIDFMTNMYYLCYRSFLKQIGVDASERLEVAFADQNSESLVFTRDTVELRQYGAVGTSAKVELPQPEYHKVTHHEMTGWTGKLFQYTILDEQSACYLNIGEFMDKQYVNAHGDKMDIGPPWLVKFFWTFRGGNFDKFLSGMFKKINRKDVDNLIIDLRENRGGTDALGYQLLDYITDIESMPKHTEYVMLSDLLKSNHPKYFAAILDGNELDEGDIALPKFIKNEQDFIGQYLRKKGSHFYHPKPEQKFQGNVYVLIGDNTFSSATNLATLFADNNLATMVGSRMRMNPTQFGEVLTFELENTGTKGRISCKKFVRPAGECGENRIQLDIEMQNTIEDEFFGKDPTFEYLLEIISNNKASVSN
ncbi:MAG: S41 family peptidase [Salinivirgaceae bacterium]